MMATQSARNKVKGPAKPRLTARRSPSKTTPASPRALIPINGEPIRKQARKAYEKARRDLDQARLQLDQFHTQDRPAFQRWMNTTFGRQVTALRELSRLVREKQDLIAEVEDFVWEHDVTEAVAYAAVQHRREHPAEADPTPSPKDDGPGSAGAHAKSRFKDLSDEEAYEKFAHAFEEVFGDRLPPGFLPPGPPPKPIQTASVKELYRTLVRKLHPDTQATMTAQKLEWWHEVQDAYAQNDAERLAMILSQIEMSDGEPSGHTSVAMFQRLTTRLKANLREVKRQLSSSRSDPAWNFSEQADSRVLAGRVRLEFLDALRQLNFTLAQHEARLRDWADQARELSERRFWRASNRR